ncbi:MAG: pilus assembly protein PilM, partial [Candidatus Andersenbacteria bacterium]
ITTTAIMIQVSADIVLPMVHLQVTNATEILPLYIHARTMAFFGTPNAFIGLDIGTSSLKLVELVNRRRRVELATYAEASVENLLVNPDGKDDQDEIEYTAELVKRMLNAAGVTSDILVGALPSSTVFSTVLTMPQIPENEMEKAVRFAARSVVPADLEEMVLGWSRLGEQPHMSTDEKNESGQAGAANEKVDAEKNADGPVPVFLTAAPKKVVDRYLEVVKRTGLKLFALEVETFPLIRSLLQEVNSSALIIDIGDQATTYHIIDDGTPRVSHTIEYGGKDITKEIAGALGISIEEAEKNKYAHGLDQSAPEKQKAATASAVDRQIKKAGDLLGLYSKQQGRQIKKTVLIGGGANLKMIKDYWAKSSGHVVQIGNPWKGLSYPEKLENQLQLLGPTYGVAVGLAQRGFVQ